MALRGDLASVDLAQVFQMLALNKKVGLLSIHSAKLWKVLYFDQRGVTVHHNVHDLLDRVVAAFVRSARLTEEAVEEVRDHAVRMGQSLADSLLAGGYVEASELEYQYRLELEEEIYDLFFCREAKFEFHENAKSLEGRDATVDERFFFNCDSIIMEAARRIDEWAFISERIPSTAEVLIATAEVIEGDEFGSDGPAIFELLDGRRNVARVIEITGLTNFQVCKSLSQLLDAGAIAPVDEGDLMPLADECMNEGRLQDAIALYERAIELEVGLPDCHARAAEAYQTAEEYELAIYHLECEAEHRVEAGDPAGGARCLHKVKHLVPTNLSARERLVELTLGPDGVKVDGFDPLSEGKELVDMLIEFGDIQRVRSLLERLLLVEPNDPDLKKALVNVHVRAGDQKRVVQLYESIADDLVRHGKPLEAVSYLQKILQLDRSRSDISERVRRLYEFDERTRRRSRALSVLAVMFCLLAVLGSGYWFYNERAEKDFQALDVHDLLSHDDFAGARQVFEDFIQKHPLTTAVASAKAELLKVASAEDLFEARRNKDRAQRQREIDAMRSRYRQHWDDHRKQFLAGKPEEALASVAMVRELLNETGAADDMAWALEQQVERTFVNLRKFLQESVELGKQYDRHIAAGDWARAREAVLKLHSDYDHTADARRARVPVMVVTRPAGAILKHAGKPLMRTVDGKQQPLLTPGLVLCQADEPVELTAEMSGFESRQIVVDGKQSAQVDVVLAVIPDRLVHFDAPAQTGVGVGDGWLAIGLRGGKVGISRTDGTSRQMRELDGLKAVDAPPAIQDGRVFFLSNENTIECLPVDAGVKTTGWPVTIEQGAATSLMVSEGRVAVIDGAGVLHCWEQATGHRVWGVALDGPPSGPPTIDRRRIYVGITDGRVMAFDAADGSSIGILRSPAGPSTRIHADKGLVFFGAADETIRAVDFEQGKVLWTQAVGGVPTELGFQVGDNRVVVASEGEVLSLDRQSGSVRARLGVKDAVRSVRLQGSRVLVQLRRARSRPRPAHDLLVAASADSLAVLWEYTLEGTGPGMVGSDDFVVALPSSSGDVVLFR